MKTQTQIIISDHALFQMRRRGIAADNARNVVRFPEQIVLSGGKRRVCQSRDRDKTSGKPLLVRVVVEEQGRFQVIISAYRTSKIDKYWKEE